MKRFTNWQLLPKVAALLTTFLVPVAVTAQDSYPDKPVTVIVSYPAGGPTDGFARELARWFETDFGVPFVVENMPGASGVIGHSHVANAAPDGYTLLFIANPVQTATPLFSDITTFKPLEDYTPIGELAVSTMGVFLSPSYAPNTVAEMIADAQARPGQVRYASSGIGSGNHLKTELFAQEAAVDLLHVPYSGSAPAMIDLMNGTVDFMIVGVASAIAQSSAGKLKLVAVAADERMDIVPDVPTVSESGLPGYMANAWYGLEGPPGLPGAIVAKLNESMSRAGADPAFVDAAARLGLEVVVGAPDAMKALIELEFAENSKLVEAMN